MDTIIAFLFEKFAPCGSYRTFSCSQWFISRVEYCYYFGWSQNHKSKKRAVVNSNYSLKFWGNFSFNREIDLNYTAVNSLFDCVICILIAAYIYRTLRMMRNDSHNSYKFVCSHGLVFTRHFGLYVLMGLSFIISSLNLVKMLLSEN